jgi:hypothetical protein
MYEWKDILIIGDSFCADRKKKFHWPQRLVSNLTDIPFVSEKLPRGKGLSGSSWWSYRKILLQELLNQVPKVLIICHTEPYRIPNDLDMSINFRSVETKLIDIDNKHHEMPKDIYEAADQYYKHLMSFDFYNWAVIKWFEEIDNLIEKYKVEKVIHFFCFEGEYNSYIFKKGVTIGIPLYTYAEDPKRYFLNFKKEDGNHYSVKGNEMFADRLTEIINNYPGDNTRLNIKMVNYEPN